MRTEWTIVAVFAAAVLLLPSASFAQDGEQGQSANGDEQSKSAKVETLAKKGAQAYRAENYRKAIELFREAHELQAVPNLLFNIGRCYEKLEEYDKAVKYYEDFAVAPGVGSKARREALDRADRLREIGEIDEKDQPRPTEEEIEAGKRAEKSGRESGSNTTAWLVTGGGAALLAGGTVFALLASSSADRIREEGLDYDERTSARKSAKTQAIVADSMFAAGAVATGIGIYLLVSPSKSEAKKSASTLVTPYAGPDGAGVGMTIQF